MRSTPLLLGTSMLLLAACGGGGGGEVDSGTDMDSSAAPDTSTPQTDAAVVVRGDVVVHPNAALTLIEGGENGTFTLALADAPTADVTIAIATNDATAASVSPASVTFTPANFATPQTITVTPVDDAAEDGPQPFTIVTSAATSDDPQYTGQAVANVAGTVADDDGPGFVVSALMGAPNEAGATASFSVRLTNAPTANVAISVVSSDIGEGTVAPAGLVFTTANFATPQMVTIAPTDDDDVDGAVGFTIVLGAAVSNDTRYQGLDPQDVAVATIDDDEAGVTVSTPTDTLCDVVGSESTFTLVLNTRPSANVTFALTTIGAPITTTSSSVTFTPADWNVPQLVIVTWEGTNIAADTSGTVVIGTAQTTDPWYTVVDPTDLTVSLCDDENEAIVVTEPSGATLVVPVRTHEVGIADTFALALSQPPAGDVTITLGASDGDEVSFAPATLTFTKTNFATRQTVTVTGHGDSATDGPQDYTITLTPSSAIDAAYDTLAAVSIAASNDAGTVDFALGRLVVVAGCQTNTPANCPGTDPPGALVDGDANSLLRFTDFGGNGAPCAIGGSCPPPPVIAPYAEVALPLGLPALDVTITCTPNNNVAVPTLSVSADGTAYTGTPYTTSTPVTIAAGTRYLRLTSAISSLQPAFNFWARSVSCASVTAIGGADL